MGHIKIISILNFLLTGKKNSSKTGCGAQFLDWEAGSRKHRKKKNFIRTRVFLLSVLLAQLSELLPPVSVVEEAHVAVHIYCSILGLKRLSDLLLLHRLLGTCFSNCDQTLSSA